MKKKAFIKSTQIIFGAYALIVLFGCTSTPRGLQHVPSQPAVVVDPSQVEADQSFASSAARLEVGGNASVIQVTPIGPAQALAVAAYKNALGESCKRVELRSRDASSVCGVCLGKDGVWRVVPRNF